MLCSMTSRGRKPADVFTRPGWFDTPCTHHAVAQCPRHAFVVFLPPPSPMGEGGVGVPQRRSPRARTSHRRFAHADKPRAQARGSIYLARFVRAPMSTSTPTMSLANRRALNARIEQDASPRCSDVSATRASCTIARQPAQARLRRTSLVPRAAMSGRVAGDGTRVTDTRSSAGP